jgi:protoporphyrinogen oxidase
MTASRTRTLILGGGLAGVSTAYHLPKNSFALVEREGEVGGTARSFFLDGFTFDFTGHLLHLHNDYTKKLIPKLLGNGFYTCKRNSWIFSKDVYTRYPFQVYTHGLPPKVVDECVMGYLESYLKGIPIEKRSTNFAVWCCQMFGDGVAKHFMHPYNEKLYQTKASNMTTDWCGPFVPMPNLSDVISGALGTNDGTFGYNATFLYPCTGGIQTLSAAMARGMKGVRLKTSVTRVDWRKKKATLSNGEEISYANMVSSIPLPQLLKVMSPLPPAIARAAAKLRYASILCLNIGVKRPKISDKSWIYFPEGDYPFYRVGFPMNFTPCVVPKGCSSMYVEVPAKRWKAAKSDAALLRDVRRGLERAHILKKSDILPVVQFLPIKYAYVIYDKNRSPALKAIFAFLADNGIQSIGRYGGWKYSFMEEAILDGRKAAEAAAGRC